MTELLEEDNEEVGLGLAVLHVIILHVCILHTLRRSSLKSWPRSKRSTGKPFPTLRRWIECSSVFRLRLVPGAQVYDRPKRLLTPGRGADPHDEVEEAHCDGDVREEDSAGLFNDVVQLNPILFSLRRCTSTRPRAPCGDDLQPCNSLSFPRIIITST